jgi:hypothetical protein
MKWAGYHLVCLFILINFKTNAQTKTETNAEKKYEVAAYYFPNYHIDSINERWHGKGWTEWDLVKSAQPRFNGHLQPKIPAWGYYDESDPGWASKEIDLASSYGIDVFIYDWYWYAKTGQFLQEGLEKGFLNASNNSKMKFAIMWANHNWANIHPTSYTNFQEKLTDGEVTLALWEKITDYLIDNYFKKSNYWKIDGKPYFSIFETARFLNSFKTLDEAASAMKRFNEKVTKAGFPGLHLNLIDQNVTDLHLKSVLQRIVTRTEVLRALNVASITSYNFLYAYDLSKAEWPTANYQNAIDANVKYWSHVSTQIGNIPFFPNITMGWDVTPRLIQSDKFDGFKGYPWVPVFNGDNTPVAFLQALKKAKIFLVDHPEQPKIIIINAWNEWTEGSYLLPDTKTSTQYLEAIKAVFSVSHVQQ